jgi:hypothetical protein
MDIYSDSSVNKPMGVGVEKKINVVFREGVESTLS